jgi:hypothetical protein
VQSVNVPDWLERAVNNEGGPVLCDREVFCAPDGTWAVWLWPEHLSPVLGLQTEEVANCVKQSLHDAYALGGKSDYFYD